MGFSLFTTYQFDKKCAYKNITQSYNTTLSVLDSSQTNKYKCFQILL